MSEFTEKSFFLDAFRGSLLTFLVGGEDLEPHGGDADTSGTEAPPGLTRFGETIAELVAGGARAWLIFSADVPWRARAATLFSDAITLDPAQGLGGFSALWRGPQRIVITPVAGGEGFLDRAVALAARFRVPRLVLTRAAGGLIDAGGGVVDFVNFEQLNRLAWGGDPILSQVSALLAGGVGEVSLCRLEEVGRELFTYEGCGTFFARRHYCQIRPLVLGDFPRVEALIRRGEAEGFLLKRTEACLNEVMTVGFGAFLGGDRLAGVCGLLREPYRAEGAGEVVSIYALTRYQGEGIGVKLLAHMTKEGRRLGLRYLFACAGSARVVAFFQRNGYRPVKHEEIPAEKWADYDPVRKQSAVALRLDLNDDRPAGGNA